IADRLEPAGDRIDLGLEELVADGVARLIAEAELLDHRLRAGRALLGEPAEAESGDLDDGAEAIAGELAGLDRAGNPQRASGRAGLDDGTAGEAARVEQQVSRLVFGRSGLQAVSERRRDPLFESGELVEIGGLWPGFDRLFETAQFIIDHQRVANAGDRPMQG